jgi:hypothetical protein
MSLEPGKMDEPITASGHTAALSVSRRLEVVELTALKCALEGVAHLPRRTQFAVVSPDARRLQRRFAQQIESTPPHCRKLHPSPVIDAAESVYDRNTGTYRQVRYHQYEMLLSALPTTCLLHFYTRFIPALSQIGRANGPICLA